MTKFHEELVRGPISSVVTRLSGSRGEFTVVAELGYATDNKRRNATEEPPEELRSRRHAIGTIAKMLGLQANDVYKALEQLRNR